MTDPNTLLEAALQQHLAHNLQPAVLLYTRLLKLYPRVLPAYNNLATIYLSEGKTKPALHLLRQALKLNPRYVPALVSLGNTYRDLGRIPEAVAAYKEAWKLNPDMFELNFNFGSLYLHLQDFHQALRLLHAAARLNPNHYQAGFNYGVCLRKLRRFPEALDHFDRMIKKFPQNPDLYYELGLTHSQHNHFPEAIQVLEAGVKQHPDHGAITASLRALYQIVADYPNAYKLEKRLKEQTYRYLKHREQPPESPGQLLQRSQDISLQQNIAAVWSQTAAATSGHLTLPRPNDIPSPATPLRIGYLSADFFNHATTHLLLGTLKAHARDRFHVTAFSHSHTDSYQQTVHTSVDSFIDLNRANLLESARLIQKQRTNILVDLKGHTHNSRLEILALKPAPIQVHFLGFPGTTGADFIDYFIADPVVLPPLHRTYFTEKIAYLPHSYQPNDTDQPISPASPQPSTSSSRFILGSFNQPYKLDGTTLSLWLNLLKKLPHSVLHQLIYHPQMQTNLTRAALAAHVDPARLFFVTKLPKPEHLRRLQAIDLALDPIAINGHTTTSDCLFAGVPVLTLAGGHFASRVSASLLTALGLSELITHTLDDYSNLAIHLATHPHALARIKRKLAIHKETYPLFDTARFTRNLEKAYATMWHRYQAGQRPAFFHITDPAPLDSKYL